MTATLTDTTAPRTDTKSIAYRFLALAAIWATLGMLWGIAMAATHDHALASAHAHLNLVGWVTMALFGLYYHATPTAAASGLARVHLALAALGVVLLVPGIALATTDGPEIVAIAGSFVTLSSMVVFLWTVLRHGLGRAA